MNFRPMFVVNGLLIAGMVGLSAWGWQAIPDGARVPTHFDIQGHADRFDGKIDTLADMPVLAIVFTLLLWAVAHIDPRSASAKFWNAMPIFMVGFLAYLHVLLVLNAVGHKIDIANALVPAMSIVFMGIGNYMGKAHSNWVSLISILLSLPRDFPWEKTRRWAGRAMVASGIVSLIAWPVLETKSATLLLFTLELGSMLAAMVMSYASWRARTNHTATGA